MQNWSEGLHEACNISLNLNQATSVLLPSEHFTDIDSSLLFQWKMNIWKYLI